MYYLQLITSGILLYIASGVIIAWYRGIFNKQQFTAIPFLGGSLGALGLYINPLVDLGYSIYLPFFIDYFSLPFLLVLLGKRLIRRMKGPENSHKRP